jgi:hypothetical protein
MNIYRVTVKGQFDDDGEVKSSTLDFLVDASSVHEAYAAGPEIAETVAYFGPKWRDFSTVQASRIEFPYMLSDTTGLVLRR